MATKKIGTKVDAVIAELAKTVHEMGEQSAATAVVSESRQKWTTHFTECAIMAGDAATWKAASDVIEHRIRTNEGGMAVAIRAAKSKKESKGSATLYTLPVIWRVAKETVNKAFQYKIAFTVTDSEGKVTQRAFSKIRTDAKNAGRAEEIAKVAEKAPIDAKRMELSDALAALGSRYRRLKPEYVQAAIDAMHKLYLAAETMMEQGNVGKAAAAVTAAAPVATTKARRTRKPDAAQASAAA